MDMPLFLSSFLQYSYIFFAGMFKCSVALCSTSQNDVNKILDRSIMKAKWVFTHVKRTCTCNAPVVYIHGS